ncbi:MAG: hypothetical protein MJZ81_12415 [Bacteroidales bacterium]|nr:hypothetical protein [Bacteroidales bacterium]
MSPDIERHIDVHVRRLASARPEGFPAGILNSDDAVAWKDFAEDRRFETTLNDSAENTICASLASAFEKIASKDYSHARYHLYDAIAAILHVDGMVTHGK